MIPWEIWSGSTQFPRIQKGATFSRMMPNAQGNFTRGCQIPGEDGFPVTPDDKHILAN